MTTQDVEAITPQTLINIRPVVASIKEFFGTSQLSQFMDQTNPLAALPTSVVFLRLDRVVFHASAQASKSATFTRLTTAACVQSRPLKVPNIGLIGLLATYGRIYAFGFVETPYRKVSTVKVLDKVDTSPLTKKTCTSSLRRTRR